MAQVERRVEKGRGGKPGPVRWRVRYISPEGRERNKTFLRKVDAERFAATVEVDKSRGEWIDPRLGRTIVEDWAEGWMAQLVHARRRPTSAGGSACRRSADAGRAGSIKAFGSPVHRPGPAYTRFDWSVLLRK